MTTRSTNPQEAFDAALDVAYDTGCEIGYHDGYRDAVTELQAFIVTGINSAQSLTPEQRKKLIKDNFEAA